MPKGYKNNYLSTISVVDFKKYHIRWEIFSYLLLILMCLHKRRHLSAYFLTVTVKIGIFHMCKSSWKRSRRPIQILKMPMTICRHWAYVCLHCYQEQHISCLSFLCNSTNTQGLPLFSVISYFQLVAWLPLVMEQHHIHLLFFSLNLSSDITWPLDGSSRWGLDILGWLTTGKYTKKKWLNHISWWGNDWPHN